MEAPLEKKPQLFRLFQRLVHLEHFLREVTDALSNTVTFQETKIPNPTPDTFSVKCDIKSLHKVSILETCNFF